MVAAEIMAGTHEPDKGALRTLVRTHYDYQKVRIMLGNRIAMHYRMQMGQEPGMRTEELSADAQKLLDTLQAEYARLADALTRCDLRRWHKVLDEHRGLITTPYEVVMAQQYSALGENEAQLSRQMDMLVRQFPVWTHFLEGVKGCGPTMAAVIISELDPYKARTPSAFWRYAGLDVGPDGAGRSRRAEHLERRSYTTRAGEEAERNSITFNPFLKTKLIGVLGTSFIKCGGHYRDLYDQHKHRLEHHARYGVASEDATATKLHRHNMAVRYCVKEFLADLWTAWRTLEGLPVRPRYSVEKLGLDHGGVD